MNLTSEGTPYTLELEGLSFVFDSFPLDRHCQDSMPWIKIPKQLGCAEQTHCMMESWNET